MAEDQDPLANLTVDDLPAPDDPLANINVDDLPEPKETNFDKFNKAILSGENYLSENLGHPIQKAAEAIVGYPTDQWTSEGKSFIDEVGGYPGLTDKVLEGTGNVLGSVIRPIGKVFDMASRVMGSTIALGIDPYRNMLGYGDLYDKYQLADLQSQLEENRKNGTPHALDPRIFPVHLSELAQDPTEQGMQAAADYLKSTGHEELAAPLEGTKKLVGFMAGLGAEIYGLPIPKIGALTEVGEAVAKEGKLTEGLAQQMAKGEAKGLGLQWGKQELPVASAKMTAPVVDKLQNLAMSMEASRPGQLARMYTTLPSLPFVGSAGQNLAFAKNLINNDQKAYASLVQDKVAQMGLDFSNPEVVKDWRSFAENPLHHKLKFKENARVYEDLYQTLNQDLQMDVERARAAGIDIKDKFGDVNIGPVRASKGYAERYIPRYANLDNSRLYDMKKIIGEGEDAEKLVQELGLKKGVSPQRSQVLSKRAPYNTDQMNKAIEESTGIKGFFNDDPIAAYAQKKADIASMIEDKKFIDGVSGNIGKSKKEWLLLRNEAFQRVQAAKAEGRIPELIDQKLSRVDINNLTTLDNDVVNRFEGLQNAIEGKKTDYSKLLYPKSDADFINGMIKTPDQGLINSYINKYMRVWKGAVFFNPGFVGRNAYENYTRAIQSGVTIPELALGQSGYVFGKGKWAKYADEMRSLEKQMGMATQVEGTAGAKIVAPMDAANQENALDRTMTTLHEMSSRGTAKKFFEQSRELGKKGYDKVVNNPLFRFSSSVNNGAENSIKFAYYAKLRDAGYEMLPAIKETDKRFISYNLMRNSVKTAQAYIPFANFMVKNAETTAKLFMENPKGALLFGPQGALERQIEKYNDWSPDQVERFKQIHGEYYTDNILGPILPGKNEMLRQKDYVNNVINSIFNPDGKNAGFQLWANLPSNYHGLLSLDPRKANELAGPAIKLALSVGKAIPNLFPDASGYPKYAQASEELMKGLDEVKSPFVPSKLINAARELQSQYWPELEGKLRSFGKSDEFIKTILGDQKNEEFKKKMQASLISAKALWMGKATKVDVDIFLRQQAMFKETSALMSQLATQQAKNGTDRGLNQHIQRMQNVLMKAADSMINFIDIKDDYDKRVESIGGTPEAEIEFQDLTTEEPPNQDDGEEPTQDQVEDETINESMNDMMKDKSWMNNRMPASDYIEFSENKGKLNIEEDGKVVQPLSDMWNTEYQDLKKANPGTKQPVEGVSRVYRAEKPSKSDWNLDAIIKKAERNGEDPHEAVRKAAEEFLKNKENIAQSNKNDRIPAGDL